MVLYFTSNVVSPPATLFMGFDKHENEELIRWGFEEDVWFHVDKVSSAHVYLRLKEGESVIGVEMTRDYEIVTVGWPGSFNLLSPLKMRWNACSTLSNLCMMDGQTVG